MDAQQGEPRGGRNSWRWGWERVCSLVSPHVAPRREGGEPRLAAADRSGVGAHWSATRGRFLTLLRPSQALVPEPKPTRGRLAAANAFPAQRPSTSTSGIPESSRARFGAREPAYEVEAAIVANGADGGRSRFGGARSVPECAGHCLSDSSSTRRRSKGRAKRKRHVAQVPRRREPVATHQADGRPARRPSSIDPGRLNLPAA